MRWPWGRRAPDVLKDGQQSPRGVERPAPYTAAPLPPPDPKLLEWSAQGAPVRWVQPQDIWAALTATPPRPHPGCEQNKMRITRIGTMEPASDGRVHAQGWQFSGFSEWAPTGRYDTSVGPDGKIGGWHLRELHAVAHGEPCMCGCAEAIERWST